jgi:hypothetical protein
MNLYSWDTRILYTSVPPTGAPRANSQRRIVIPNVLSMRELCGTGTLACAKASLWRTQAPAGVPVPHKRGYSAFNLPCR